MLTPKLARRIVCGMGFAYFEYEFFIFLTVRFDNFWRDSICIYTRAVITIPPIHMLAFPYAFF